MFSDRLKPDHRSVSVYFLCISQTCECGALSGRPYWCAAAGTDLSVSSLGSSEETWHSTKIYETKYIKIYEKKTKIYEKRLKTKIYEKNVLSHVQG